MLPTEHGKRNTGATDCGSISAAGCGGRGDPQSPGLADSLTTAAGPSDPAALLIAGSPWLSLACKVSRTQPTHGGLMPGQLATPEISAPTDRLILAQECVRGRVHGSSGDNIVLTGVCLEGDSVSMGV